MRGEEAKCVEGVGGIEGEADVSAEREWSSFEEREGVSSLDDEATDGVEEAGAAGGKS